MTAATTGGTIPRAADPLCGSSPELPHFFVSGPAQGMERGWPQPRTRPATGPAHTAGHCRETLCRDKDISCHDASLQNFFLLHNFLDLQMVPPSGTPEDLHICASHRHSRDALRSNQSLGASRFCPFSLPACLSPPLAPRRRAGYDSRLARERRSCPSRARQHVRHAACLRHAITGHPVPARPASGNDASFQPCTAMKNSCSPRVFLPILLLLALALSACQFSSSAPSKAPAPKPATPTGPHIALALPSSGPYAGGAKIRNGAEIALRELQAGGLLAQLHMVDTSKPDWNAQLAALPPNCVMVGGPCRPRLQAAPDVRHAGKARLLRLHAQPAAR